MEKVILKSEIRKESGKSGAKALRKKDIVPCVCYKGGKEALNLQVDYRELWGVLHTKAGENVLVTLEIKGDKDYKDKTVLIKEVQHDPLKGRIIHVDFNEISLTEKIEVDVPVSARGEAEGVVKDGGVLDIVMWELKIECLPTDIPEKIEVEIAKMKIGDAIAIKDITPPKGVKILNDPEQIVVAVHPPHVEKVEEAAVEGEAAAEPEVIKKGKKEEEEAAEEEAPPSEKKGKEEKAG